MPLATGLSSRQSAENSPRQLRAVPMSQLRCPCAPPATLRLPRLVDEAAAPAGSAPERTSAPEPDAPPRGKATISPASRHAHLLQDVIRCLLFHLDASVNRKATRVPASMAPSSRPLLTSSPVFLQWPVPAINVHGARLYIRHESSIRGLADSSCVDSSAMLLAMSDDYSHHPHPISRARRHGARGWYCNPECGVNSGTASAAAGHCSIVYLRAVSQYLPPTSAPLTRATALANRFNPTSY